MLPVSLRTTKNDACFNPLRRKYSLADIAANGSLVPSEKYRGFRAAHDFQPQPGDRLCPITRTKAHPECTWIVGGQTYEFCCPPCIAEFVRQAKEQPERIMSAEEYVAKKSLKKSVRHP